MVGMVAVQLDGASIEVLERIAAAQIIMAAIMVVIGLIAIGGAIVVLLELRNTRRLLHNLGETVDELKPRLAPLVDRAIHVTSDVAGMTDNIRRRIDDALFTIEQLNRAVKRGAISAEERVRRFGEVLDVVQSEAEELLLDAAATARGVHEAARQLRESEPRRRPGRRPPPPTIEVDDEEIEEMFE